MRRAALVFPLLLTLFAASGASAAKPQALLVVTKGSAHARGGKLTGSFVVANRGPERSPKATAMVRLDGEPGAKPPRLALQRATVRALAVGATHRIAVAANIPVGIEGSWRVLACATLCHPIGSLTESGETAGRPGSEGGKTTRSGAETASAGPGGGSPPGSSTDGPTPGGEPAPGPGDSDPPSPPASTVPTDPIAHPVDEPFEVSDGAVHYWAFVPDSYDASNQTATPLLVWLHGCYGEAEGEAWVVDPGDETEPPQDWMTITLAGREGGAEGVCWVPSVDEAKVMAALADVETHFNVDRQRVILGGYSSGGDLAYRTGFRHSSTFAGLLIENSSPFRDTESTEAESLAAATTKLHIVHLAHLQDTTYPIAGVRSETEAVKAAGFPIELIEVAGEHFNGPGEVVEGHPVPGTDADLRTYLLPHIDDGWLAPTP